MKLSVELSRKMKGRLVPVLFLLVLGVSHVLADPQQGPEKPCGEEATTAATRQCLNRRLAEADSELNRVYSKLLAGLSRADRVKLKEAQAAWIRFRDKNAVFAASPVAGGTLEPVLKMVDLLESTEKRKAQLTEYFRVRQ